MSGTDILHELLKATPEELAAGPDQPDFEAWWPYWRNACLHYRSTIDRAILSGFSADRVAWAFAGGYQAALRRLDPDLPDGDVVALCVTEKTGRPRDILAQLTRRDAGWHLSGSKRFVTLADKASILLVAARTGEANGRPTLRIAHVRADDPGVAISVHKPLPFTPEMAHGSVTLDVALGRDRVLDDDGYTTAIKPFRTLEDLHVTAAITAHLLRLACIGRWPDGLRSRIVLTLETLRGLAVRPASDPVLHIALDGLLQGLHELLTAAGPHWDSDDESAARWARDVPLLSIAEVVRQQRTLRAWEGFR